MVDLPKSRHHSLRPRRRSLETSAARLQWLVKFKKGLNTQLADTQHILGIVRMRQLPAMGSGSVGIFRSRDPSTHISRHPRVPSAPRSTHPRTPASPSFSSSASPTMHLSLSLVSSPWHKLRLKAKHLARKSTNRWAYSPHSSFACERCSWKPPSPPPSGVDHFVELFRSNTPFEI